MRLHPFFLRKVTKKMKKIEDDAAEKRKRLCIFFSFGVGDGGWKQAPSQGTVTGCIVAGSKTAMTMRVHATDLRGR